MVSIDGLYYDKDFSAKSPSLFLIGNEPHREQTFEAMEEVMWSNNLGLFSYIFLDFYLCFSAVGYAKARSSIWPWFYYVLSFGMPKSKSDCWKSNGLYSWLYFEIPETDVRSAAQIRSGGHFYSQNF